jgi:hypothetical protein
MNRDELKGSPMVLATGRGLPPDPNEPDIGDLAAWCAYHGIEYTKGADPGPAVAEPGT